MTPLNEADTTTPEPKRAERTLVLRISEEDYRRYRSRATARGLKNPEFLHLLLELEAKAGG